MDDLYETGLDVLQHPDQYEIDYSVATNWVEVGDWKLFWNAAEIALQSDSIEDLAWLRPQAETALAYLDQWQGADPYADWLRQRMDYFGVAEDAVIESSPTTTVRRVAPPTQPHQKPLILPLPREVSKTPISDIVVTKRVQDRDVWQKRLANRPLPKNADQLIPRLKKAFQSEGVPEALVWMAEVESSLNPKAKNPIGAAGLFQFMPQTAKRFGLSLLPFDDRLNPEKSARAAAQYLKMLYRKFDAWPLVLASYNSGEGKVARLLKESGGTGFEDIAHRLPAETRMYVPKIDALVRLRENVNLAELPACR